MLKPYPKRVVIVFGIFIYWLTDLEGAANVVSTLEQTVAAKQQHYSKDSQGKMSYTITRFCHQNHATCWTLL